MVAWLLRNWDDNPERFGLAFPLDPLDEAIATPERGGFFVELIRATAADLAGDAPPDERLWDHEVAWEPERRAHWRERLAALARMVEAVLPELPRA